MSDDLEQSAALINLAPGVFVAESALRLQYSRSGGPGGQNVNKVNTRVQLWVPLAAITGLSENAMNRLRILAGSRLTIAGELNITAETERTQERNRQAVLDRLRELIGSAVKEPKRRRKTKPSRGAKERRLKGKRLRSETKARRQGRGD
ncbi:MAG: Class peptide chain release factor [Phycisphaerales bacterium]|nr:Class peptide chain release factor [Phycisphaerales bacterium]